MSARMRRGAGLGETERFPLALRRGLAAVQREDEA
jgi:hypothetical protein